jgi:hypothetical protein
VDADLKLAGGLEQFSLHGFLLRGSGMYGNSRAIDFRELCNYWKYRHLQAHDWV